MKLGVGSDQLSNVWLVSRCRIDIEFSRFGSVITFKSNFFIPATYIEGFLVFHRIFFTVYSNYAITAYIDDS